MSQANPTHDYFQALFNAIPSPILIVDGDVQVQEANTAGFALLGSRNSIYRRKGGDILHCIHASRSPEGCGHSVECPECIIRNSVGKAIAGEAVTRIRLRMERSDGRGTIETYLLVTASPFDYEDRRLALLQLEDIDELMALKGLLPICAWCKKVRDDDQYWKSVEVYLKSHTAIDVSHGICDECLEKQLRGLNR